MFSDGFWRALGVLLDDVGGGCWDMFGGFSVDFEWLLDSFTEVV